MEGAGETWSGNAACGSWTRRRSKALKGSPEVAITQSPLKPRKMRMASQVGIRKDGLAGPEDTRRTLEQTNVRVETRKRCVVQLQEGKGTW